MTSSTIPTLEEAMSELREAATAQDVASDVYRVAHQRMRDAEIALRVAQERFDKARGLLLQAALGDCEPKSWF